MDGIRKMSKAIRLLKDYVDKDININQIEILLHLAENEPEPVSYSALSKLMGKSTVSISLYINMLNEYYNKAPIAGELDDTDHGLVKASLSPYDSEEYVVFLTDRGTKVVWMLNELIR